MTADLPTQQEIADDMILRRYLDEEFPADGFGTVWVQATSETKGVLHRAGFKRTRSMAEYEVTVRYDDLGFLRIAARN